MTEEEKQEYKILQIKRAFLYSRLKTVENKYKEIKEEYDGIANRLYELENSISE